MIRIGIATAAIAAGIVLSVLSPTAQAEVPPGGTAVALPSPLPPREAGARHGQALGVALICYGLRTTPAVDRLPTQYQGEAKAQFDAESAKILTSWREASSCKKAGGPNACRLVYEWSCAAALREIGPEGTALPGLVEKKTP
ncbi:MAG: hypothetical protein K2Y42_08050 [Hyphomicrobium sp.]|jgi:hypothetical protein|uniref:hypothetical protein n=1 Tax=Hyphomicrobium sp. TaxID=82 RepID=UPI0025C0416D|nr:hypothetical protein [Hyphomicrobium sp.]MBX9862692.1 hypothetical protein [Hyphomicrobium sp.]